MARKIGLSAACREVLGEHLRPDVFRALGEPNRLAVIGRLASAAGPVTVSDISECCGVHLSGVSRHLAILRDAGLVRAERRGREVFYELDCSSLTGLLRGLADALDDCRTTCCRPQEER